MGGRVGKSAMVDATETTDCPTGHMTQALAVCEKKKLLNISFPTASVKLLFCSFM